MTRNKNVLPSIISIILGLKYWDLRFICNKNKGGDKTSTTELFTKIFFRQTNFFPCEKNGLISKAVENNGWSVPKVYKTAFNCRLNIKPPCEIVLRPTLAAYSYSIAALGKDDVFTVYH
jgi:hypothetical protein